MKITPNIAKEIKNMYINGESGHTIARKFDIHYSTVYDCLKRNDVKVRSIKDAGVLASSKGRIFKHKILPSHVKMTTEKSYILGVICGDGYVHCTKNKSYQTSLQAIDKDFVLEFANSLKRVYGLEIPINKVKISTPNWNDKWQARVCCKEIFNDILKHGSLKMNTWRIPKIILNSSKEVKCGFLRGFFDSEAHVDSTYRKITAVSINEIGLKEVKKLLSSLSIDSNLRKTKKYGNRKDCFSLTISGRNNLLNYCNGIGFSIKRKQMKLNDIINSQKLFVKTHKKVKKLKTKMIKLRENGLSYEKIGKELGIGTATVWVYLNKKHNSRN